MADLRIGYLLARHADRMNLISEINWLFHVQQSNVSVQVDPPVIFGVDDNLINGHNLLGASFKPGSHRVNSQRDN